MPRIHVAKRTIVLKLVYYGPGLSGKTTNLRALHASVDEKRRGRLIQLDTDTERTLFFDYFPLALGEVGGFRIVVEISSVPGQAFYNETRFALLEDVDGIVFVADSGSNREEANLVSLRNLQQNLEKHGRKMEEVPLVFQWNKRDLPRTTSLKLMERQLNPGGAPSFEAVASDGTGVKECHAAIVRLMMAQLRSRPELGASA